MQNNLLDLQTNRLLEKFGAGNHKPGSGSAVALQGMLSAQLILTVIALTNDEKRRHYYEEIISDLLKMDAEIKGQAYPELERLLLKDSVQFDKVINLRLAREEEEDLFQKSRLASQALEELKIATEIPIEIANLCLKLTEFALIAFDQGFKSARGDSGVALNCAISAVAGCLSIIDLNLLSFTNDVWTEKINSEANRLRSRYKELYFETTVRQRALKEEADQIKLFYMEIEALLSSIPDESVLSNSDIENIASRLQRTIWINRGMLWKNDKPKNPIDVLKPEVALKKMGYQFDRQERLGQHIGHGGLLETAGQIDKQNKIVTISKNFPSETQNFTTAHELGHALFHKQSILHRDRALDGNTLSNSRDMKELQADKFAAYFLMPRKHVKALFKRLFFTDKFIVNEGTVFALNERSIGNLKEKCQDLRGLSRLLASAEYFNNKSFKSISEQFHVSVETMAIRLEELDLLEF